MHSINFLDAPALTYLTINLIILLAKKHKFNSQKCQNIVVGFLIEREGN